MWADLSLKKAITFPGNNVVQYPQNLKQPEAKHSTHGFWEMLFKPPSNHFILLYPEDTVKHEKSI